MNDSPLPEQLAFDPVIENGEGFSAPRQAILAGMGGSHLAGDLLKSWDPSMPLEIWSDYGLPEEMMHEVLVIACSYSGNTEEVLDAYATAKGRELKVLAISTGGKLLEHAKQDGIPFIQIPDIGIQPRAALGFMAKAILKALGNDRGLSEITGCAIAADNGMEEKITEHLRGAIPVIYSSRRNSALAQIWKIKFNEGSKIPAFWNVFPELNHNEMQGLDSNGIAQAKDILRFVFLTDADDGERIAKRMAATRKILEDKGCRVIEAPLAGSGRFGRLFGSLGLADGVAARLAGKYGVDPENTVLIEEFKKTIAS